VKASTTAPQQVEILSLSSPINFYLGYQFELKWAVAEGAKGYVVTTLAKPPYNDRISIEGFLDSEETDEDSLKTFPPVNNFSPGDQDTELQIPWFMFWYYGEHTIKLYAIDQNFYDLSTSQVMYASQSSEYEQPTFRIDGGLGIFAAVSVDSVKVRVLRAPD
jgi:hypothetical protein